MTNYNTLDEAQAIIDLRLYTEDWELASEDQRQKALNMATMDIDSLRYMGDKTSSDQEHEFPRDITIDLVPDDIKVAEVEITLARLGGKDPENIQDNMDISAEGFSSVRTTYQPYTPLEHKRAGIVSVAAFGRLRQYLDMSKEIKISRV